MAGSDEFSKKISGNSFMELSEGYCEKQPLVDTPQFSPLRRQVLLTVAPFLLLTCIGICSGYSAILLPQLKSEGELNLTEDDESWIASIIILPVVPGCLLSGIFLEKFGCKLLLTVPCVPYIAGCIVLYYSKTAKMIMFARFLQGILGGALGPSPSVYVGETSDPKYRGLLLASLPLGIALGTFLVHLVGSFLTWRTTALMCATPSIISTIVILLCPESPSWLVRRGRHHEAGVSFHWCRGHSEEAKEELHALLRKQKHHESSEQPTALRYLFNPEFIKPLVLSCIYLAMTQFGGTHTMHFYSITMIQDVMEGAMNEYLATLVLDVVRVVLSAVACVFLTNCGRKPLLLWGAIGLCVSVFVLSAYLAASRTYPVLLDYPSVPLFLLIAFTAFSSASLIPLSNCFTAELLPLRMRGFANGVVFSVNFACLFGVIKISPAMFSGIGMAGTFFVYGVVVAVGSFVVYLFIPEAKGKTLLEVEEFFRRGRD